MAKDPIPNTAPIEFLHTPLPVYDALIALPSCNEYENLPEVIQSLEKNPESYTSKTFVLINVNNRQDADPSNNLKTIDWLKSYTGQLNIAYLNSSEPPYSYKGKFGVGLARHQACTEGCKYIDAKTPVISLDGDSPVNSEYLEEIFKHIKSNPTFSAGHVNFKHRLEGTAEEIAAIQMYDKHLHYHREQLEKAGSPHAWYAIGSTIVCTKEAYLKSGGYNPRRMAGEDFYLLQQLSKVGYKIEMLAKAFVYPSNRQSDRVPFGTGKAVTDIVQSGQWLTYNPQCYEKLADFLTLIRNNLNNNADKILQKSPEEICPWLESRKFTDVWAKLQQNSKNETALLNRFNEWLDAFQTLKLIHYLTENNFPKIKI